MSVGPVTSLILGCIVLAILVSVLIWLGKYMGFLDQVLADKIIKGTGIIIIVILVLAAIMLVLNAFGASIPIRLP